MEIPPMTPITELGIAGAAFDRQEYNIHTRSSRAFSPPRKSSIRAYFSNVKHAILNGPTDTRSETWCVPVRLVAGRKDAHRWDAVAALDSQCKYNLVSTRTVEKEALNIERIERSHFANTITGQPMYCLGYVDMRLYCKVKIKSMLGREPTFQQRYYNMRFLVVESGNFEVIVGHRSMEDEGIYRDKEIICPVRLIAPATGDTTTVQQAADERRRLERILVQQDEQRRLEEQRRRIAQQKSRDAST